MSVSVSVIIPVYNTGKYLKKCIDSVLQQNFESFEIIAVNDGSTDNSSEILNRIAEKDGRVKPITQENKGLGGARNTGIEKAEGEYLLFLDSDDTIKNGTLFTCYEAAKETGADIVCFGMESVREDGSTISFKKIHEGPMKVCYRDEKPLFFADNPFITNKLIKRSLFIDNNIFFPERVWYEDIRTLAKLYLNINKIALLEDCFYNYLIRENSIMHVKNTDRNVEMIYAMEDIIGYYKEKGEYEKRRDELLYTTCLHVMVFATLRVAAIDPKYKLLKEFYDFTETNFPDFKKSTLPKENFTMRHRVIFEFSKRKMYFALKMLDRLNKLR